MKKYIYNVHVKTYVRYNDFYKLEEDMKEMGFCLINLETEINDSMADMIFGSNDYKSWEKYMRKTHEQ